MADITTATADLVYRLQTYFNPKLLTALEFNLVLASYGLSQGYSIHGTTIRFFRPRAASKTGVVALTEATTPVTRTEVPVGYVDITLSQRGELSEAISDVVQGTDLLNIVQLYVKTFGEDAALSLDSVIRDVLISTLLNSDNTYTGKRFERFAGVEPTGDSSTDFATMHALGAANAKMTRERHLTMLTQLKTARVKPINGLYVAVISPAVEHDMRQDETTVKAMTQVDTQKLYKGGKFELDGAVFVVQDNTFREEAVYGTESTTGSNYANIYLGRDAFGVPSLTDKRPGSGPMKPKLQIVTGADKTDPLDQYCLVGWKNFYGAKPFITNVTGEVPRYGILRTKSTFVG